MAVNSKGEVVLAGHSENCISILNLRQERKFNIGDQITRRGSLRYPFGVTIDNQDNIYVVDNDRQPRLPLSSDHILKFNSEGTFQAIIGSTGKGDLQFDHPVGICFNKTNHLLYVCDQRNHRIQVLTTDLTFVEKFGEKGGNDGQFNCPRNLAFDSDNNLYITDTENNRIQVFTAQGKFLRAFSERGTKKPLERPNAIAIDSSNVVYVSEIGQQCVSMFTSQGEYFATFGQYGNEDGQFISISGLSIDYNDYILVSDCHSNKIQIF